MIVKKPNCPLYRDIDDVCNESEIIKIINIESHPTENHDIIDYLLKCPKHRTIEGRRLEERDWKFQGKNQLIINYIKEKKLPIKIDENSHSIKELMEAIEKTWDKL
jgi:hypothetical protein